MCDATFLRRGRKAHQCHRASKARIYSSVAYAPAWPTTKVLRISLCLYHYKMLQHRLPNKGHVWTKAGAITAVDKDSIVYATVIASPVIRLPRDYNGEPIALTMSLGVIVNDELLRARTIMEP